MRRFQILHLLSFTALTAVVFAVMRWIDLPALHFLVILLIYFAPVFCYVVAEVLGRSNRRFRVKARTILIGLTLGLVITAAWVTNITTPFLLLGLSWVPQLIVLKICSMKRSMLAASDF